MNRILTIAAIAVTAIAAACARDREEAAGPTVERDYQVGAFDRIEVAGPYEVEVRTASAPSVHARGSERMIERLVVEVRDGRLLIHPGKSRSFRWSSNHKAHLTVTVPALRGADIAGSGDIKIDRVQGDSFAGQIAGSGNLSIGAIDVQTVSFGIAGSGDARLGEGRAKTVALEIGGSGDIDAQSVVGETLSASIAGSGNIAAKATGQAAVTIMGSGNVDVSGGAKCTISKHGSGEVRCS